MLYLYPSNKLEHLASLLNSLMRLHPASPFSARTLLVQHTGMQHWLSMELAKQSGIAMHLDFPLPTRFIWETCRTILGDSNVPRQSPYKREAMVWRILAIVDSDECKQSVHYKELQAFWSDDGLRAEIKQFRFAQQLSDLFEQYLIFRPDWLLAWDENKDFHINSQDSFSSVCYQWQKWFWRALVKRMPQHPLILQKRAIAALSQNKKALPDNIYLFAVNSISPGYLDFFNALAEHIDVHWFHLNPCVDYWADALSDKALAKRMRKNSMLAWINDAQALEEQSLGLSEIGQAHPLLRNFGQQGRDLLKLLLDCQYMEISAFEPPKLLPQEPYGLLQQLQHDILSQDETAHKTSFDAHSNIHVHACHNHVRELQVLKDFLLAELEANDELGLDDILVMCPAIEEYSPFIEGVFHSNDNLRLAFSISDRKPLESQASIVAFLNLLSLAQSRFSVPLIMQLLETPAIMQKFDFSSSDIAFCRACLDNAHIAFAIDKSHKAKLVDAQNPSAVSDKYTWVWGLKRLLSGIFVSDEQKMANEVAIAHTLDGQSQLTLGKLIAFVSDLVDLNETLHNARTINNWHLFFEELKTQFFDKQHQESEFAYRLLEQAFSQLHEHALLAQYDECVPLALIRQALEQTLSIPESKARFMSGRITFCSMMPMRSIPFKVLAILGLNQKSFPRQSHISELDLIAKADARIGDRSRRSDDRYLFLEAIISARQSLYLSYQYRSVQSNAQREPSLALKELIEHCHAQYSKACIDIVEHPLHPFSETSFTSTNAYSGSFDSAWARHARQLQGMNIESSAHGAVFQHANEKHVFGQVLEEHSEVNFAFDLNDLVDFYQDPMSYFARRCLSLSFPKIEALQAQQPFETHGLNIYQLRESWFYQSASAEKDDENAANAANAKHFDTILKASGDFPEFADIEELFAQHKLDINALREYIASQEWCPLSGQVSFEFDHQLARYRLVESSLNQQSQRISVAFQGLLNKEQQLVSILYKEDAKLKDRLQLWFSYIFYLCQTSEGAQQDKAANSSLEERHDGSQNHGDARIVYAKHHYGKAKLFEDVLPSVEPQRAKQLAEKLIYWFLEGQKRVLFVNPHLLTELSQFQDVDDALADSDFCAIWQKQADDKGQHSPYDALSKNPYFAYFFQQVPMLSRAQLEIYFDVYLPMLQPEVLDDIEAQKA